MIHKILATALPLLAIADVVLAGGESKPENYRRVHRHRHGRQAQPAEAHEDDLLKRDNYVKTVTELLYITVDQHGVPWGTSFETASQVAPKEYLAQSESATSAESSLSSSMLASSSSSSSVIVVLPSSTSMTVEAVSSSASEAPAQPSSKTTAPTSEPTSTLSEYSASAGLTRKFPDGTIPCSSFPAAYGALALDYLGNEGWTGIQLDGGDVKECSEGALCSYACAPGQSKSQWPSDQPTSGESHGGLLCKNGFLTLTRPDVPYLCVAGKGSASVQNKMNKAVALCRTDYPGTENMVIPTYVLSDGSQPISVVDASTYYVWEGGSTSAQYYVNKAGISPEEGCLWGTLSQLVGNFAPMVFGAGYSNGMSCISMLPNPEAKGAPLGYNVEIVGMDGTTLNKECSYKNGVFSGDDQTGCTVCFTEGNAAFVLSD